MTPSDAKLLTFRVGAMPYAVAIEGVREVMRMPRVSRVPHAPPAMLGLANLHGTVIPVLSAAALLGGHDSQLTRLIVVDHGELMGLAVDDASQVLSSRESGAARTLDIAGLVARSMPGKAPHRSRGADVAPLREVAVETDLVTLVVFSIGDQEFALPPGVVDAALRMPAGIAPMPDADDVVVGSAAIGGAVLPLLSLRALLALPAGGSETTSRVLVIRIGTSRVGLLVDELRGVLRVPSGQIDPLPQALKRGDAEARIQAICRLDEGERLVSVLAADQLLRDDITARILAEADVEPDTMPDTIIAGGTGRGSEQFLIFRIGNDEFGLPIACVEEVARLPAKLTRLPKAPAFVQGVMNLRGQVIPVIDQAQRFGAASSGSSRRRVIVVRIGEVQAGFVVDTASEIVRVNATSIRTAPDLGNTQTRVFERVANLTDEQRIILIVSPRELLDRAEQDVLLGLGKKGSKAPL